MKMTTLYSDCFQQIVARVLDGNPRILSCHLPHVDYYLMASKSLLSVAIHTFQTQSDSHLTVNSPSLCNTNINARDISVKSNHIRAVNPIRFSLTLISANRNPRRTLTRASRRKPRNGTLLNGNKPNKARWTNATYLQKRDLPMQRAKTTNYMRNE